MTTGPWNTEAEKQDIQRLYAEARAKLVIRRDEATQ